MIHAGAGYADVVRLYRAAGWCGVLPLPPGQKVPPPDGFTGRRAADPTDAQIEAWATQHPNGNVALRMPAGVVAIDVDNYGPKQGGRTLAAAEGQWGRLPATWRSTSRPDDQTSGIRYFRLPAGVELAGQIEMGVNGTRTGDIEIIQRHHRFAVVFPSMHPEERQYVWFRPDGAPAAEGEIPRPYDFPELPQTWLTGLLTQHREGDPAAVLNTLPPGEPCPKMQQARQKALDACQGPSRHDNVNRRVLAIVRLGEQGHAGAPTILDEVRCAFAAAVAKDRQGGTGEARQEFNRMLGGALRKVAGDPTQAFERGCFCGQVRDDAMTDAHLAEVVTSELLSGHWLWSKGLDWFRWDGRHWQMVPEEQQHEELRQYLRSKYREAVEEMHQLAMRMNALEARRAMAVVESGDAPSVQEIADLAERHDAAKQKAKEWKAVLSRARIAAISTLTRGILLRDACEFDAKHDLLNVENGVVELSTGVLKPHDPELLLTKLAPVSYRPEARNPDWDKALAAVPEDVREWYQERLGQAITGHIPPDDLLVVQVGTGENGKTTVMSAVQAVLGDYFVLASERVLIADPTAHPTELMDLRGARLALIEETPEERRLSVSRLKKIVGNPRITARRMRENSVTFPTTHALFVSTNYPPIVEETDHGTWRRLACLRFPYLFRKPGTALRGPNDRRGDTGLRQRLQEGREGQHEAVLAWLVQGALRWYTAGRRMSLPPARVQKDTRTWQRSSDLLLRYIDEQLVFDCERHVMSTELLKHFNAWLSERGHHQWSDRTFGDRFKDHHEVAAHHVRKGRPHLHPDKLSRPPGGLETETRKQYHAWLGVRFRTEDDPMDDDDSDLDASTYPGEACNATNQTTSEGGQSQPPSDPHSGGFRSQGPFEDHTAATRHSARPSNSDVTAVTAVTGADVDGKIDSRGLSRVGHLGNPSQPSQRAETELGEAPRQPIAPPPALPGADQEPTLSRSVGPQPPAPAEPSALEPLGPTPAACQHGTIVFDDTSTYCGDCGAGRRPDGSWLPPDSAPAASEALDDEWEVWRP